MDNYTFKRECIAYLYDNNDLSLSIKFISKIIEAINKDKHSFKWNGIIVSLNKGIDMIFAEVCPLCENPYHGDKVVDHNHKTMKVRFALHNHCNFKLGNIEKYGITPFINTYDNNWLQNAKSYLEYGFDDKI